MQKFCAYASYNGFNPSIEAIMVLIKSYLFAFNFKLSAVTALFKRWRLE